MLSTFYLVMLRKLHKLYNKLPVFFHVLVLKCIYSNRVRIFSLISISIHYFIQTK